jgi:hypothetical protein
MKQNCCILILFFLFGIFFSSCSKDENIIIDDSFDMKIESNLTEVAFPYELVVFEVKITNRNKAALNNVKMNGSNLMVFSGPYNDINNDNVLEHGEVWIYKGSCNIDPSEINSNGGGDGFIDIEIKVNGNTVNGDFKENKVVTKIGIRKGYIGNVRLTNQSEVDSFGAQKYFSISGKLLIGSFDENGYPTQKMESDILNLNSLKSLKRVGTLGINSNKNIVNLEGLNDVSITDGGLVISNNPSLLEINALSNVSNVLAINIINNTNLKSIEGIKNITSVEYSVLINDNNSLTSLEGLNKLESVEDFQVINNKALIDFGSLNSLKNINGTFRIADNPLLLNIKGLSSLKKILNGLFIYNNDSLVSLDGLNSLTTNTNGIDIEGNGSLKNIDGISSLTEIFGALTISNNAQLLNINGCSNFTRIGNYLRIENNNMLSNIDGLNKLMQIDSYLWISFNKSLSNLCGLKQLLLNKGLKEDSFYLNYNAYNPSKNDITNGNCYQ